MASHTVLVSLVQSKLCFALLALPTHYILSTAEWDESFHIVIGAWLVIFGGVAAVEKMFDPQAKSFGAVLGVTSMAAAVYFTTLVTSVLLHRGFFHRLRKTPGPYYARFSKFYAIFAGVLPEMQYYDWLESLHKEYQSDVLRTGPREVTVYSADAISLIHGANSKCTKPTMYSAAGSIGGTSLHMSRNKEEHMRRRKIWDNAFKTKALKDYEPRLDRHAAALMSKLRDRAGDASVRISDWVNFYSFDVIGDIGFSRSFGMVEKGEEAPIIKLLHASLTPLSILVHLSWAVSLVTRTGAGTKPIHEHISWSKTVLEERKRTVPKENDIFSALLSPGDSQITKEMNADSRLIIIAGSDTVSTTLAWISYELCKDQKMQAKLREAVDLVEPEKTHLDVNDVSSCAYLNGVINEGLRLHPAIPSSVQRETPPEGITLPSGEYIPGRVIIYTPIYSLQRDPRYWREPLAFMPERWTDERPDAILDKRAFIPFNTGPYNCIGQRLSILELRSVTANLVRNFEIEFAPGEDGSAIVKGSHDNFTTNVGTLDVKLKLRKRAGGA